MSVKTLSALSIAMPSWIAIYIRGTHCMRKNYSDERFLKQCRYFLSIIFHHCADLAKWILNYEFTPGRIAWGRQTVIDDFISRLSFHLDKNLTTMARKSILKSVKLQSLENVVLRSSQILYIFIIRAEVLTTFQSNVVAFKTYMAGPYFSRILQHFVTKLCTLLILRCCF